MKNKKQEFRIIPQGATQPCVAECAEVGEACTAVNVRECDDALRVVGTPPVASNIPAGHRLLLVDGDRYITLSAGEVYYGGNVLATVTGELVGAHRVGNMVVLTTTAGIVWLKRTDTGYDEVNLEDARPAITLTALEGTTVSAGMDAITFNASYPTWPAVLNTSDVAALTTQLHRAWNEVQQNVDAASAYGGMMLARIGVRLIDDSYMWLGDPVTLGTETLADSNRVTAVCTLGGTAVTGIPATTLTRHRYRVGITVGGGIAGEWQSLIKAVDVLATVCAPPVLPNGTAQYRCIARGGSVSSPRLEFGLPAVGEGAIRSQLAQSGWRVIASTTDLAALANHEWVSDAVARSAGTSYVVTREVEQADRLTAQEAEAITQASTPIYPVTSMTCNGRLYCMDPDGVLWVSAPGNALVTARQQAITGVTVRKIMPLTRPIYSNGFGRYPVALFTDEGIYALPQTNTGSTFGEPRLLDRMVIDAHCQPIEANRDLYFSSERGDLCRLHGSEVTVMWKGTGVCQFAWDEVHHEVWALPADGTTLAVMPSGRVSQRTVTCVQLYSDARHALAVTTTGQVLNLTHEEAMSVQMVTWQSHPMVMPAPHQMVWQVMGNGTLSLEVRGERGISCHGFVVGRLRVSGQMNAPLLQRLVSPPLRTVRLSVSGVAESGTLLLPVLID